MTINSLKILHINIVAKAKYALATMSVLFCVACSSDNVIEEIKEIDTTGSDLMRFTRATEVKSSSSTRTGDYLKTDFMVSTYKAFGNTAAQQTVMDKYKVNYYSGGTSWDGNTTDNWEYISVDGQKEKYWDYSNPPYRFNAIAPYPTDITGFVLSDKNLTINAAYKAQKVSDGNLSNIDGTNVAAEPYMLAQVQRGGTEWKDIDIFDNSTESVNNQTTTKDRYIALPFHHLNTKVRFGVYSLNPWPTENKLYIKDLTISATADNKFVTSAGKYKASGTESWKKDTDNSGFEELTTADNATTKTTLLTFSGLSGSTPLEDNDLRKHQGQTSAYFLQCKDGFLQIPQEGVKMYVSLNLMQEGNDTPFKTYTNIPVVLKLEDNLTQDKFNWVSGNIYTYYLILDFEQKLEIQFTATLSPWEDISGSLSTDLEK